MSKRKAYWKIPKRVGKPKGLSPEKQLQILELLPESGEKVQASVLAKKAREEKNISPNTLFAHLNVLERNMQVSKEIVKRKGRGAAYAVFYRRITDSELFGEKLASVLNELKKTLKNLAEWIKVGGKGIPESERSKWLNNYAIYSLGAVSGMLSVFCSHASGIKDGEKRKEFLDVVLRVHVLPILHELAGAIDSRAWLSAWYPIEPVVVKARAENEALEEIIAKILSSCISGKTFDQLQDEFCQG
jgi:DNA-binding HxlR family transcriptional regulator